MKPGGLKKIETEIERPKPDHRTSEEILAKLCEPDILVPADYARVYDGGVLEPEEQLMVSVLEEGVADFQRFVLARDKKGARRFTEAETWIMSDDNDWVFSFANCCAVLGIEPGYLRKGLLAWREDRLARRNLALQQLSKYFFCKAA